MRKPDTDQQATEQDAGNRRRSTRKTGAEEYHLYFLPDGKGGPRERKGSVPLDVDPIEAIDERKDLEPGLYRIEKRKGGEFAKEVCHYTKEEAVVSTKDSAAALVEEDEASEEEYLLTSSASDDDARIAKLVASTVRAVLDARTKREMAVQGQPDPMEQFRQMRLMLKEEREEMSHQLRDLMPPRDSSPSSPEMDPETQATVYFVKQTGALKEMLRATRDVITTPERIDEPESWTARLFDFAKEFVPYIGPIVSPVIGQRLISMLGQVDDASLLQAAGVNASQANSHPSPGGATPTSQVAPNPPQAQTEVAPDVTFESVLEGLITDLLEGNEPDDAVNDIVTLTTLQPAFLDVVAKMMSNPNAQLVQMLGQAKGVDLTLLVNTDTYIDALREGLKQRIRLPAVQTPEVEAAPVKEHGPAASRNGHKGRLGSGAAMAQARVGGV